MLRKTHLAIGVSAALYFLPLVNYKLLFVPAVIIATLLPDLDSAFSKIGKNNGGGIIQGVLGHRGLLHSYTFCILFSMIFAFFYPILALPVFLGYSFHLLADSFTVRGIKPLWPLKFVSKGNLTTGGKSEDIVFWVFIIINVILLVLLFIR